MKSVAVRRSRAAGLSLAVGFVARADRVVAAMTRRDVDPELAIQLARAGRAGHVDLRDVAADDVQADEQHAARGAALARSAPTSQRSRSRSASRPTPRAAGGEVAAVARPPRGMRASAYGAVWLRRRSTRMRESPVATISGR
jgi:hypothetical protein